MKVIFFANTDWYLFNFRLDLAKYLRQRNFEVVMISPIGPYGKKLEEAGFRWIAIPMARRSLNPFQEAQLLLRLILIFRRERPNIVHLFTIKCIIYGGLAARFAGVRALVGAIAGLGYIFASQSLLAGVLRTPVCMLMRVALGGRQTRVILQNSDDCEVVRSSSIIDPSRIRLIPGSGVNTDRFTPFSRQSRVTRPHQRVLLAARLLWEKGIGEYVVAARILKRDGLNVKFFIAGEPDVGNPNSVPLSQVDQWRKEGTIIPLGHVREMAKLLDLIDLMVLPSFYREGVPRSLIEAASAGLPIITTDTPGCRDVVEHNVSGLLVPAKDPNALANAMRIILQDPAIGRHMGEAGRAKVLREFDERLVFKKTLDVYRELLPEGKLILE